jgi:predicted RNA methylase
MRTKTVNLDDATRETLLRSRIEGCNLFLPGQIPREEYQRVARAIEAAGGKWNRKAGCHVFPADVRETLNIGADTVSVVNVQQTFQAFDTPAQVAAQMCQWADLTAGDTLLEPSAGTGNLIRAAVESGIFRADIVAVEIDSKKADKLNAGEVLCRDFLSIQGFDNQPDGFDKVLMNPPFTGGADIRHVEHALKFLRAGGRLAGICMAGPHRDAALMPLADTWEELPEDTFAKSGTKTRTVLFTITKN